ncbi:MAG: hypothetical protein EDM05_050590 [Leptolyngbya sp. IPPAS B-1204]|nr:hypothetical protein [Elainella sp. C42_A2020_010]RNJ69381.1 MAG: hypothetical protein EDM05_11090 [Leptolyngbya sp. IPPAS B-1204]
MQYAASIIQNSVRLTHRKPKLKTKNWYYASGERERLKLILIGSAEGIREMIHKMHQRDLAEVGSWSRLLPVPNSDEVMSVLMLYRRRSE